MKLVLKLNLGVADAKKFSLEPKEALEGATVDVSEEAGNELLQRGWAVHESDVDASAKKVQAVPPVEVKAETNPPKPADFGKNPHAPK